MESLANELLREILSHISGEQDTISASTLALRRAFQDLVCLSCTCRRLRDVCNTFFETITTRVVQRDKEFYALTRDDDPEKLPTSDPGPTVLWAARRGHLNLLQQMAAVGKAGPDFFASRFKYPAYCPESHPDFAGDPSKENSEDLSEILRPFWHYQEKGRHEEGFHWWFDDLASTTPLHIAAKYGHAEVVEWLLETFKQTATLHDSAIEAPESSPCICFAAFSRLLMDQHRASRAPLLTPLQTALAWRSWDVVHIWLRDGAVLDHPIDRAQPIHSWHRRGFETFGITALHILAAEGGGEDDIDISLLRGGQQQTLQDIGDFEGYYTLHYACYSEMYNRGTLSLDKQLDFIEELVDAGAQLDAHVSDDQEWHDKMVNEERWQPFDPPPPPLPFAVINGAFITARALLCLGATASIDPCGGAHFRDYEGYEDSLEDFSHAADADSNRNGQEASGDAGAEDIENGRDRGGAEMSESSGNVRAEKAETRLEALQFLLLHLQYMWLEEDSSLCPSALQEAKALEEELLEAIKEEEEGEMHE